MFTGIVNKKGTKKPKYTKYFVNTDDTDHSL